MYRENFPNATSETLIETSPATNDYNCIAWTLGKTNAWYDSTPGYTWPWSHRDRMFASAITSIVELYRREGFLECQSLELEPGFEKVAIYSTEGRFKHAALQLVNGEWTSKMGPFEDVQHATAETLIGPELETIARVMKRERSGS
jgi:hypothetical protein